MSSNNNLLADLASASAKAVFTVVFFFICGTLMAKFQVITKKGNLVLSEVLQFLVVPSFLFNALASQLSVEKLQVAWPLMIVGAIAPFVSGIAAYPIAKFFSGAPEWFIQWFMLACMFPNTVALPVILVVPICEQVTFYAYDKHGNLLFHEQRNGTKIPATLSKVECISQANLYIFIYVLINGVLFWIVGYNIRVSKQAIEDEVRVPQPVASSSLPPPPLQPVVEEEFEKTNDIDQNTELELKDIEESLSLSPPPPPPPPPPPLLSTLQEQNQQHERILDPKPRLSKAGSSSTSSRYFSATSRAKALFLPQGSFMVGSAKTEGKRFEALQESNKSVHSSKERCIQICRVIISTMLKPPLAAQLLGVFVGVIYPLQDVLFNPNSWLRPITAAIEIIGSGSPSLSNISLSASLGNKIIGSSRQTLFKFDGLPSRCIPILIITKMLLIPGILYSLTYLILPLLPEDRLLRLICFIEVITPTANMTVVMATILKQQIQSEIISAAVLGQYIVAFPAFILWLSVAFFITADVV